MDFKYLNFYWFIGFILFGHKKRWFLNQLNTLDVSYRKIGCFFCLSFEDKEVLDFLLPANFLKLPNHFFYRLDIDKESIDLFIEKKLPRFYFDYMKDFLFYLKHEGGEYDFHWSIECETFYITFFNQKTQEIIKKASVDKDDKEGLKEILDNFRHQSIKMSVNALNFFEKDLKERFISGFGIPFEDYIMEVEPLSEDNCNVWFTHSQTSRKILVRSVRYDETTGRVCFAGQSDNTLFL